MFEEMSHEDIIKYMRVNEEAENDAREYLIQSNYPFIIHTISQVTGRYVEIENSEELSVGLVAFNEAITRYSDSKGARFLSFAKIVITSRIRDYLNKENNKTGDVSLDQMMEETGQEVSAKEPEQSVDVAEEIEAWEKLLKKFGFDLEELATESPKHVDTRKNAVVLSEQISDEDDLVDHMYIKYRLPVTKIVLRFKTTSKVVKRSKKFIIATVVILTKNFNLLKNWIYQGEKRCSSC